ncbi:tetratricopeptide repeat protein [Microbacteriaceae bacterium VKM Ac-2854]|nr:tetratricopeptide repeat protein [Microbacteriaceae bacterium VKM Ac-2854]
MTDINDRFEAVWALDLPDDELRARIDAVAAELPEGDPVAAFERGGSWDSTGHPDQAIVLYRAALAAGLDGSRRRQATIQLASSLRNLGAVAESVSLLQAELARGSDELDDAVRVFLALALTDAGRGREAVALLIRTITPQMTRYQRSAAAYADALGE